MKGRKEILLAFLLGAVLPGLLLRLAVTENRSPVDDLTVTVLNGDITVQMDLEEYIVGVLLAEMPGDFEEEALKAQAVAARTFTLHNIEKGTKHKDGDICTLSTCCQGYISPEEYISGGGMAAAVHKMYEAVKATKGRVLLYEGDLIDATYFSSSGGRTEDAMAVWGISVPYLQSVESEEMVGSHTTEMRKEVFNEALGLPEGEVYIESPTYTQGGGIAQVRINGKTFTGVQLRQHLGLRSTQISIYVGKESVQIVTKGYGHRVGMSQYGADAMAADGSDYIQILTHYYSGVTIQHYTGYEN